MFEQSIVTAQTSLKDAFKDFFYIGSCINDAHVWERIPKSIKIVEEQFNSITGKYLNGQGFTPNRINTTLNG
jgi:hypothetical protein